MFSCRSTLNKSEDPGDKKKKKDVVKSLSEEERIYYDHLIEEQIDLLEKNLHCKVYTNQIPGLSESRSLENFPGEEECTDIITKEKHKYCCNKVEDILTRMESIPLKINIVNHFNAIFALNSKEKIIQYLGLLGVQIKEDEVKDDELSYEHDPIFFKIYSFAKLYYSVLQSNDFHKAFKYFYITDRNHYRDVLNLTILYRTMIDKEKNQALDSTSSELSSSTRETFKIPRHLKIAALFHDIERYSGQIQYESLSYLTSAHDKIRKKILHPMNTVAIIDILFRKNPNFLMLHDNVLQDEINNSISIILQHDIPLTKDEDRQEKIVYAEPSSKAPINPGMESSHVLFDDLKALITADSMALFRHTYPFFILYIKNKSGDNWRKAVLDRLKTSLKKVPLKYQGEIRSHVDESIKDFAMYSDSTITTSQNLKIIDEVTNEFKKLLP